MKIEATNKERDWIINNMSGGVCEGCPAREACKKKEQEEAIKGIIEEHRSTCRDILSGFLEIEIVEEMEIRQLMCKAIVICEYGTEKEFKIILNEIRNKIKDME